MQSEDLDFAELKAMPGRVQSFLQILEPANTKGQRGGWEGLQGVEGAGRKIQVAYEENTEVGRPTCLSIASDGKSLKGRAVYLEVIKML